MMDSKLRMSINVGLLAGVIMLGVSAIGMVETFDQRSLITGLVTLGQLLLFVPPLGAAYLAAQRSKETDPGRVMLHGSVAGLFSALPLVALIFLTVLLPNIREQLVNVSPALISILTFGQGAFVGSVLRLLANLIMGVIGSGLFLLPSRFRRPVINGIVGMFAVAILSEMLLNILRPLPDNLVNFFFGSKGVEPITALLLLVTIPLLSFWWDLRGRDAYQKRWASLPPAGQQRAQRMMHDPEVGSARRHLVVEHQQRLGAAAHLDRRHGIALRAVGDDKAAVHQRILDFDPVGIRPVLDCGAHQPPHGPCRAPPQIRLIVCPIQPQDVVGAVDPHRLAVPGPGRPHFERLDRRGLKTVYIRLRPGNDKRATKARFHLPNACLVPFLLPES